MLPNWTDGLQTFGKWLEYFQMAEMHWLLLPCKKKKKEMKGMNEIWTLSYPHQFCVHHIAVEAMCLRFTFVSQTDSHFFSVSEVLGHRKATPSHNQQFHSTANPQQPEAYQHCEALAPESATAVAAMWAFVSAGCVGFDIFFRLGRSWCDVCFILGRWCGELSV